MVEYAIPKPFKNSDSYGAYDYLVYKNGDPADYGKKLSQDPYAMLTDFAECFDSYKRLKAAAISDTDGSYSVPMACLGADITVFGVFDEAKRYVLKTAEAAGVRINYEVGDLLDADERFFDSFDAVIIKKSVIHYFYDIKTFFNIICSMLKTGGKLVCLDFHPFYQNGVCRVGDCCFSHILRQLPEESEKRYALTDILQAVSLCGLKITSFDEKTAAEDMTDGARACLTAEKI